MAQMVVLGEIMYDPAESMPQYLVVENITATPFDIAEWQLNEGVHFRFPSFASNTPAATQLKAYERIVISAVDESAFRGVYKVQAGLKVFGPWSGKLAKHGERVTLQDKNGAVVCSLKYDTRAPWPSVANGTGHSLVINNPNRPLQDPNNWIASKGPVTTITLRREDLLPKEEIPAEVLPLTKSEVIINEIMFDPPGSGGKGEYVEIYNRGEAELDLSGWAFQKGIRFEFPTGTHLRAGGFLVLAQDAARLREVYDGVPVLGDFQGALSNDGETIRLVDNRGSLANEVSFRAGGEWPVRPNSGSSLELINPAMDNRWPSAWRASDETRKGEWRSYSCTNVYRELDPLGQPSDYRELHLQLAGSGHVALRSLALLHGSSNCLVNTLRVSTNGAGDSGWLCQGTHWASFVTNDEIHVVSDGRGDDRANRLEIDVPSLKPNTDYVLKFEARWISGTPRLIARTWDRSIERSFLLEVPRGLGTPGLVNSQYRRLPGPQAEQLKHSPAVPKPGQRVQVTARVWSSDPLASVELFHRADQKDGQGRWLIEQMFDDGVHGGDLRTGDHIFSAELGGYKTKGEVVQFFVLATSKNGETALLPRAGSQKPALFVVDDQVLPTDLRTVRLVLAIRDLEAMANGNTTAFGYKFPLHSSHYFNATVIMNEAEIWHGAEARSGGSLLTRSGELRKPKLRLPEDQPFRGHTRFVYDDDAASGAAYHNRLTRYLLYLLDQPVSQNEFVRVVINAGPPALREETEPIGKEFLNRNFSGGSHGELYQISEDWSLLDNWEGTFKDADWTYQGDAAVAYRNSWSKRTGETEDDYSRLIELFKRISQTNVSPGEVDRLLDANAALKLTAVRGFAGDWDTFTMQRGRNGFFYCAPGGKFQFLHWDGDEGFVTGQPFYGERVKTWVEQPRNKRLLYYHLLNLVRLCSQSPERVKAWLQAEQEAAGKSVFQATYLTFFKKREAEVLAALDGGDRIPFQVKEPAGMLAIENGEINLTGQAPYGIFGVRIAGHPEAKVEWTSDVSWKISGLKLAPGETGLSIKGMDEAGQTIAERKVDRITAQSATNSQ